MKKVFFVFFSFLCLLLLVSCSGISTKIIDVPKPVVSNAEINNNSEQDRENGEQEKEAYEEGVCVDSGIVEKDEEAVSDEVIQTDVSDAYVPNNTDVTDESDVESVQSYTKILIASNSTVFNPSQINRSTNVRLAGNHINGLILKPDEEFSFNKIVGPRTAERGFLPADIFVGQSVVKGYGGGICQTSSTICGAVRQTDMKILEQNPHSQRVTYTTSDNEAMISYGSSDFRFVNTYENPVSIEISYIPNDSGETIKCDIYMLE